MLVLSRKAGEAIKIAEDIEITVISVEGQRVRLGVRAPRSVSVIRSELDPLIVQANQTAVVNLSSNKELLRKVAEARKNQ
jgi:carbon storage regulator